MKRFFTLMLCLVSLSAGAGAINHSLENIMEMVKQFKGEPTNLRPRRIHNKYQGRYEFVPRSSAEENLAFWRNTVFDIERTKGGFVRFQSGLAEKKPAIHILITPLNKTEAENFMVSIGRLKDELDRIGLSDALTLRTSPSTRYSQAKVTFDLTQDSSAQISKAMKTILRRMNRESNPEDFF